ncbi:hypothetical protein LIER_19913 [Lithospermum erythrorhizon]|uniref:Mitochondrial protein n=1 Tax=Lithospermum erythrorhizon TaxID=34254 RepID=A0AAV3QJF8_LITER
MHQALCPFTGSFVVVLWRDRFFVAVSKCEFGVDQVLFLGYIVSAQGLEVDPAKILATLSWPTPKTVMEFSRSFVFLSSLRPPF